MYQLYIKSCTKPGHVINTHKTAFFFVFVLEINTFAYSNIISNDFNDLFSITGRTLVSVQPYVTKSSTENATSH